MILENTKIPPFLVVTPILTLSIPLLYPVLLKKEKVQV